MNDAYYNEWRLLQWTVIITRNGDFFYSERWLLQETAIFYNERWLLNQRRLLQ